LAIGNNTLTVTGSSGATATFGNVTLSGNATFSPAAGVVLTLGAVGQDANSRAITQAGAGTLMLTGTSTYTGPTSINSGTVIVSGSLSGTITTSLSGGATLLVAATGSIAGPGVQNSGTVTGTGSIAGLILTIGGKVAPGTGALGVGTLSAGSLSLDSASTLSIALAGTASAQFSQISTNSVELNSDSGSGAALALALAGGYLPAPGDLFTLILSGTPPDNMFSNAKTNYIGGSTYGFSMAGQQWEINYAYPGAGSGSGMDASAFATATGGNNVAILAVPEPGSLEMLVTALGITLSLQRLRRRRSIPSFCLALR
jgi:autotransporter-associated beta strand protein